MIRFLFLLLTLMSFNSCRFIEEEDDNLNDIQLQAGQWRWVYSINEVNQNDTLAVAGDSTNDVLIKREARKKTRSSIKYQFMIDGDVVQSHLISSISYTNSSGPNAENYNATSINYHGISEEFTHYIIRDNPTIEGFYMYGFPYSSINGTMVRNYFAKEQ